jgi:DNA-binding NtrC family response regulator
LRRRYATRPSARIAQALQAERRALTKTRGNRTRAAEVLEISHRALLYKIKDTTSSFEDAAQKLRTGMPWEELICLYAL